MAENANNQEVILGLELNAKISKPFIKYNLLLLKKLVETIKSDENHFLKDLVPAFEVPEEAVEKYHNSYGKNFETSLRFEIKADELPDANQL